MSDDTSSHVRVSHLYDELLYFIADERTPAIKSQKPRPTVDGMFLLLYYIILYFRPNCKWASDFTESDYFVPWLVQPWKCHSLYL